MFEVDDDDLIVSVIYLINISKQSRERSRLIFFINDIEIYNDRMVVI